MNASKIITDFRRKHKDALDNAAKLALDPEANHDLMKAVGLAVPRSVVYSGQLRIKLPTYPGWLVTNGVCHKTNTGITTTSSGPFARTLVLAQAITNAPLGAEDIYRPVHGIANITYGQVYWPIESSFRLPIAQQLNTLVSSSFGSTTTALSLPGSVITAAVGGYNMSASSLTSSSSEGVAPQGAWKASLGPVMNNPVDVRPVEYAWTMALTSGDWPMDTTPQTPYVHVIGEMGNSWNTGNYNKDTLQGLGGGGTVPAANIPLVVIDRATGSLVDPNVLPLLIPMGKSGNMIVNCSMSFNAHCVGQANWTPHSWGPTLTFYVPIVNGTGGALNTATIAYPRVSTVAISSDRANDISMKVDFEFNVPIPPFATQALLSFLVSGGTVTNFDHGFFQQSTVAVRMVHETSTLRPSMCTLGLGTNTITTLSLSSALVTESTPDNALLLGINPVHAGTEELLTDIEGILGTAFTSTNALTAAHKPILSPEITAEQVTPALAEVVRPSESGTFVFPLLSSLASAALPSLMDLGKRMIGGAIGAAAGDDTRRDPNLTKDDVLKILQQFLARSQSNTATAVIPVGALRFVDDAKAAAMYGPPSRVKVSKEVPAKALATALSGLAGAPKARSRKRGVKGGKKAAEGAEKAAANLAAAMSGAISGGQADYGRLSNTGVINFKNLLALPKAWTSVVASTLPVSGWAVVDAEDVPQNDPPSRYDLIGNGVVPPLGPTAVVTGGMHIEFQDGNTFDNWCPVPVGLYTLGRDSCYFLTPIVDTTISHTSTIVTNAALVQQLVQHKGIAWGIGIHDTNQPSFWLIFVSDRRVEFDLTSKYGRLRRTVKYGSFDNLHVDMRLLNSFGKLATQFLKAYHAQPYPTYVTSLCSLDRGDYEHQAFGGSLIGPTLAALTGLSDDIMLTGTPFDEGQAVMPGLARMKASLVRNNAQYDKGFIPTDDIPTKLYAIATDGRNPFPPLSEFKQTVLSCIATPETGDTRKSTRVA